MATNRIVGILAACAFFGVALGQGAGSVAFNDSIVGNLRYIPAGTFMQGASINEPCAGGNEFQFQHQLTQAFAMMETEVTQQMWATLRLNDLTLPQNPSVPEYGIGLTLPVNHVDWRLAILFANRLSFRQGLTQCYFTDTGFTTPVNVSNYQAGPIYCNFQASGYRLPTEAEWEYACRAGTATPFYVEDPGYGPGSCTACSSTPFGAFNNAAWWCGNAVVSQPVGVKTANAWNLKDMHGNVEEWCWDAYGMYPTGSYTDYRGEWATGVDRVTRGGSFNDNPSYCRSAARDLAPPLAPTVQGFRLVRNASSGPCPPPQITLQPSDVTITAGQTATLVITATGTGMLYYQWYTSLTGQVWVMVPDATSPFYITPQLSYNRKYKVRVVDDCDVPVDSNEVTVTVEGCEDPLITKQPASTTILAGDRAMLSVTAGGSAPHAYQWYLGASPSTTAPIEGAVSSTYTTPALTASQSYWVKVENGCGMVESSTATVSVQSCLVPTIVSQPANRTVQPGQPTTLSVQVRGTAPFQYEWYTGPSQQTGTIIPGAELPYYTTPPLSASAWFWVKVTNGCGYTFSGAALVTVEACTPVTIATQPVGTTIPTGGTATLGVAATGTEPVYFQWYQGSSGDTTMPIADAITAVLTVGPLSQTTPYWVKLTNGCGSVNSATALVTVQPCQPPSFIAQPIGQDIAPWRPVLLSAGAEGTQPLLYQWYLGQSGDTRNPIPGAIGSQYNTPVLGRNTTFWVRVSNPCGFIDSLAAAVTLQACTPPVITQQPQGTTILPGQPTTLAVLADGYGTLDYQWYKGISGDTSTPVAGAVTASYTTPAMTLTTHYWVSVTNDCGTVRSNTATVTVNAGKSVINSQPQPQSVQAGERATLRVAYYGGPQKKLDACQWYNGESGDTSNPVAGATAPEYTTPSLDSSTSYWCEVDGSADSQTATVQVQGTGESTLYAAHIATDANWWSRITLVNLSDNATDAYFDAFLGSGLSAYAKGAPQRTILPGNTCVIRAEDILQPGSDYWLKIRSSKKLAGVVEFGMKGNPTTEVILPLIDMGSKSMVYPYVVSGVGSWYTGVTLINTSPVPVQYVVSAYKEDGTPLAAVGPLYLPASSKYVRMVNTIFPSEAGVNPSDIRFLKVETTADQDSLVGFELFGIFSTQGGLSGLPTYAIPVDPASPSSTSTLHLGEIPDNTEWYTGMTFSNLGSVPVTANADLLDDKGAVITSNSFTVGPQSQMTREVWSLFDGVVHTGASRVRVTSPTPLLGFEINAARNGMESLDFDGLLGLGGGLTKQSFPLVRCSSGWTTVLTLNNLAGADNAYTLRVFSDAGSELGSLPGSLAAGYQGKLDLAALFPAQAASIAWAKLESAQPILAGATLKNTATNQVGKYVGIQYP